MWCAADLIERRPGAQAPRVGCRRALRRCVPAWRLHVRIRLVLGAVCPRLRRCSIRSPKKTVGARVTGNTCNGVAEDYGSLAAHYAVTPPQASRRVRCTYLPSHSCSFSFPAHLGSPSPFGAATKYARTPACTAPSASRICTLIMRERSHTPATTRRLHQRNTSVASQHLSLPLPSPPRDASPNSNFFFDKCS